MTLRLLAVMSVVLLLALASSALLVSHYQAQVMDEVARTAAAVGRATLETFEIARAGETDPAAPGALTWHPQEGPPLPESLPLETGPHSVALRRFVHATGERDPVVVTCRSENGEEERCESTTAEGDARFEFLIRIDDVRAETDPADGLVLKIPRAVRLPLAGEVPPGDGEREATIEVRALPAGATRAFSAVEELHLPIPVGDYDALFARMRRRSLWLFLGVFVVGTALSAGLASRFTRPIRRLDAGIRRLGEDDLDVEVEVRGKDEIARLARAFNDMTRRLRANRARTRELVRREKLSALGRLAAGVAHDVRNPLHSIGLTLQHLRDTGRPEQPERAAEFDQSVDVIRGEIRRLDRIVSDFLQFAGSERSERQDVDLAALLRETARLVAKEAEWRGVKLEIDVEGEPPPVHADEEALRSAILNLVLNSFEALPGGGNLRLGLRAEGEHLVVEVRDDGVGVPAEERERIFEFAYTTREGGSGLGLAIVHQTIVEQHGGRVSIESEPGAGTCVRLEIPRLARDRA